MKKLYSYLSLSVLMLFAFANSVSAIVNYDMPSTNELNKSKGWAYVEQVSEGVGTTDLKFVSTRAFYSCFEYRTDGDTSQKTSNANYNPAITDGLYPFHCENNSNETFTIHANRYVEVRMVFGAERDERFDWTRFDVLYQLKGKDVKKATGGIEMSTPSQQMQFSAFDQGSSTFDKGEVEYWNYDYPGVLHYKANVMCASVDNESKSARFMFRIPDGWPGLTGLYVVSTVYDGGTPATKGDTYGHTATGDLNTAMSWCENGNTSFNMYPITDGNLVVHK